MHTLRVMPENLHHRRNCIAWPVQVDVIRLRLNATADAFSTHESANRMPRRAVR